MSVPGYRSGRFEPGHQHVVSKHFIRVASVDSAVKLVPAGDNLVKGVQCYEIFGGIALENHAFLCDALFQITV